MRKNIIQRVFLNNKNVKFSNVYKRGYFNNILLNNEMKYVCNSFFKERNFFIKNEGKSVNFFSTEKEEVNVFSKEQVEEKVLTVLKKYLPDGVEIKYDEELEKNKTKDNRAWDFLDTVEFLIDIESEFNITIPDETADNIKTVKEIIDYLVQLNIKKE
ncbi:acyl carrier protein [Plasmodium brasilianum]|uniref:Acyl carrier protein mitochondrial puative n=2 Tax=Plasmodium (Plasmodium) TaxID=418103 RepID=A0A1A8WBY3_PLAMA|nr:mitochondrial ACP precursor, putative [Plasmodium malariae]KAI4835609.1 acyl carrier protein [Plasmodium brasilianum]SBS89240.1 acyl carrier protein mitochondrial puative [Plasmodium malariae]SBT72000.1 mitochondrial ACP precursor, putative [Plasmodium malariae]SCP02535.1 mitochondrial ACP precursor, putative [Plasmodium malariae]